MPLENFPKKICCRYLNVLTFVATLFLFKFWKQVTTTTKGCSLFKEKWKKVSVIIIIKLQHNEGQLRWVKSPKKFLRYQNSAPSISIVLRELRKPNAIFIRRNFFLHQCVAFFQWFKKKLNESVLIYRHWNVNLRYSVKTNAEV